MKLALLLATSIPLIHNSVVSLATRLFVFAPSVETNYPRPFWPLQPRRLPPATPHNDWVPSVMLVLLACDSSELTVLAASPLLQGQKSTNLPSKNTKAQPKIRV